MHQSDAILIKLNINSIYFSYHGIFLNTVPKEAHGDISSGIREEEKESESRRNYQ